MIQLVLKVCGPCKFSVNNFVDSRGLYVSRSNRLVNGLSASVRSCFVSVLTSGSNSLLGLCLRGGMVYFSSGGRHNGVRC